MIAYEASRVLWGTLWRKLCFGRVMDNQPLNIWILTNEELDEAFAVLDDIEIPETDEETRTTLERWVNDAKLRRNQ